MNIGVPTGKWVDQKLWYVYTIEYFRQKERNSYHPSQSMDRTEEHYAKWNKPGSERQIAYDFAYKWNLINKTNNQAKYNQRHWNKK